MSDVSRKRLNPDLYPVALCHLAPPVRFDLHRAGEGRGPAYSLFERVTIKRVDESKPARGFSDYKVEIKEDNLPAGISIIKLP
jgi:hypothetical protein